MKGTKKSSDQLETAKNTFANFQFLLSFVKVSCQFLKSFCKKNTVLFTFFVRYFLTFQAKLVKRAKQQFCSFNKFCPTIIEKNNVRIFWKYRPKIIKSIRFKLPSTTTTLILCSWMQNSFKLSLNCWFSQWFLAFLELLLLCTSKPAIDNFKGPSCIYI